MKKDIKMIAALIICFLFLPTGCDFHNPEFMKPVELKTETVGFTTTGTYVWQLPGNAYEEEITLEMIGGGQSGGMAEAGGGQSGCWCITEQGQRGSCGGYFLEKILVSKNTEYTVIVGQGGKGGYLVYGGISAFSGKDANKSTPSASPTCHPEGYGMGGLGGTCSLCNLSPGSPGASGAVFISYTAKVE
ncbi:MAG: hypothetical protein JW881_08145 [Spirochaetales bacterium]|nr:hypothetical protein [Spirochaetales bacterium]